MEDDFITITRDEYEFLQDESKFLQCIYNVGLSNSPLFQLAMDKYYEISTSKQMSLDSFPEEDK